MQFSRQIGPSWLRPRTPVKRIGVLQRLPSLSLLRLVARYDRSTVIGQFGAVSTEEAKLDDRRRHQDEEQYDGCRSRQAHNQPAIEYLVIDVVNNHTGCASRAALSRNSNRVEDLERPDDAGDQHKRQDRPQQGQRDMPEL